MKHITMAVALLVCLASSVQAQPFGCGEPRKEHDAWQDESNKAVRVSANTLRGISALCLITVRTEAWVIGAAGGATVANGAHSAPVFFIQPVAKWGTVNSESKHWLIYPGGVWELIGYGHKSTDIIQPPATPQDCSIWDGGGVYYEWSIQEERCVERLGSPILIDPARDGLKLTSAADGVLFDLDADGIPEQVAWTRTDSDDSWLAMDRNGNGRIDSGAELFGNHTEAMPGITALNGFEALKFLDRGGFEAIDANDAAFGQLLLWNDANHNGFSEPSELTPLSASVGGIDTAYKEKRKHDQFDNQFRQKGKLTWLDGEEGVVYDVWLRKQQ